MARTGWTTGLILTLLIGGARAEEKIDAPTTAPATAPTPAPSTQPVEAPVSPDVQKIIERLGGDGFRDRQRAEDELVAMGLDVLPQLRRAAGEARDDEVR